MNRLISFLVPSRCLEHRNQQFDAFEKNTADPSAIEFLVKFDDDHEEAQVFIEDQIKKRPFQIKYIITPRVEGTFSLWIAVEQLFGLSDRSSYFVQVLSDEPHFMTPNWDEVLRGYIGFYSDHVFRLRLSTMKHNNYASHYECTFRCDSFPIYTRRWLELTEGTGDCWGSDAYQQCVAFHLGLGPGGYFNYYREGSLCRDVPVNNIEMGGLEFGVGVSEAMQRERQIRNLREWRRLTTYQMQENFSYLARRIFCYIWANENKIKSFTLIADVSKKTVMVVGSDGSVLREVSYRLQPSVIYIQNFVRDFNTLHLVSASRTIQQFKMSAMGFFDKYRLHYRSKRGRFSVLAMLKSFIIKAVRQMRHLIFFLTRVAYRLISPFIFRRALNFAICKFFTRLDAALCRWKLKMRQLRQMLSAGYKKPLDFIKHNRLKRGRFSVLAMLKSRNIKAVRRVIHILLFLMTNMLRVAKQFLSEGLRWMRVAYRRIFPFSFRRGVNSVICQLCNRLDVALCRWKSKARQLTRMLSASYQKPIHFIKHHCSKRARFSIVAMLKSFIIKTVRRVRHLLFFLMISILYVAKQFLSEGIRWMRVAYRRLFPFSFRRGLNSLICQLSNRLDAALCGWKSRVRQLTLMLSASYKKPLDFIKYFSHQKFKKKKVEKAKSLEPRNEFVHCESPGIDVLYRKKFTLQPCVSMPDARQKIQAREIINSLLQQRLLYRQKQFDLNGESS